MNKVTLPTEEIREENTIGERISYIRRKQKIKQEELANKLHIKRNALSNYEKDKRTPPLDIIINLSKILEIPTDYLLGLNEIEEYDFSNKAIHKEIGLSPKAIKVLKKMKKFDKNKLDTINFLLEQEEIPPISSFGFTYEKEDTPEKIKEMEQKAFEQYEQEEDKWNNRHFTILNAINKFFNVQIPNEELCITKNSLKKENVFTTQLQKILHTEEKIDLKKVVDNALLSDIQLELRKAKKYMERKKQSKK